jgi:hypothetical protein
MGGEILDGNAVYKNAARFGSLRRFLAAGYSLLGKKFIYSQGSSSLPTPKIPR